MRIAVAKRFVQILITMLLVSLFVFLLQDFSLGDKYSVLLSEESANDELLLFREQSGLDKSLIVRYLYFLKSFFTLDWGESNSGLDIAKIIFQRLPVTLSLGLFSVLLSLLVAVPWAIASVRKRSGFADRALSFFSTIALSLPSFLTSLFLVIVFSIILKWFPVAGYVPMHDSVIGYFRSLFLPSVALSILHLSILLRIFREALLDNMGKSYCISLIAQGAGTMDVIMHGAIKPSIPVCVSLLAQSLASSFAGSAVTESVFAIPGLGSLMVSAALSRDVQLCSVIIMIIAFISSFVFFLSELVSFLIDPRIREGK